MNSLIKYNKSVLKYEVLDCSVEITASTKKEGTVSITYTIDEWKTSRHKAASLVNKDKDLFIYRISLPVNSAVNVRMWFALKLSIPSLFSNAPEEVWDNNFGWNYEIFTDKLPKICLPSTAKAPALPTSPSKVDNPSINSTNNINNTYSKVETHSSYAPSHPSFASSKLPASTPSSYSTTYVNASITSAPSSYSTSYIYSPTPIEPSSHNNSYLSYPSSSSDTSPFTYAYSIPPRSLASPSSPFTKHKPRALSFDTHPQSRIAPRDDNCYYNEKSYPLIAFLSRKDSMLQAFLDSEAPLINSQQVRAA